MKNPTHTHTTPHIGKVPKPEPVLFRALTGRAEVQKSGAWNRAQIKMCGWMCGVLAAVFQDFSLDRRLGNL